MTQREHSHDADHLASKILSGDRRSAARAMRLVDDGSAGCRELLDALFPHTGRAHVVGVAGSPGCGKSTLVDGLIGVGRAQGLRVGVVAVDPSSSITGGALLGDRVRMQRHAGDDGVFIRSVATRGTVGGLSSSTQDIARVLDAMGFDLVIIETVGVGQDEVEIASVADTVLVVLSPDTGDAVQIMKAGIMEVGDIFVVNKADRPGADMVSRELALFFQINHVDPAPPVRETVASLKQGIEELLEAVRDHRAGLEPSRKRTRMRAELRRRVAERVVAQVDREMGPQIEDQLDAIEAGELTPYLVVDRLIQRLAGETPPGRDPAHCTGG